MRGAGAGQAGPERAPRARRPLAARVEESRKAWGRCWREKEDPREEEEEKPNLIFGLEMGFPPHLQSKESQINQHDPPPPPTPFPSTREGHFLPGQTERAGAGDMLTFLEPPKENTRWD